MIRIEKRIPIPKPKHNGGRLRVYPWPDMQVGDSFLFPKYITKRTSARAAVAYGAKMTGFRFSVRQTPRGFRCWRIE